MAEVKSDSVGKDHHEVGLFAQLIRDFESKSGERNIRDFLMYYADRNKYPAPLQALAAVVKDELDSAKRELRDCPIGEKGEWFTFEQVCKLDPALPREELKNRLRSSKTIARRTEPQGKKEITYYWISPYNAVELDAVGKTPIKWSRKLSNYRAAQIDYDTISHRLKKFNLEDTVQVTLESSPPAILERPRAEPVAVAPPIESPRVEELQVVEPEGIRMKVADIKAAGSRYNPFYLSGIISKDQTKFYAVHGPGKGRPWVALVTRDNYWRLGLKKYPSDPDPEPAAPTFIKPLGRNDYVAPPIPPTSTIGVKGSEEKPTPALVTTQEKSPAEVPTLDIILSTKERVAIKSTETYPRSYVASILRDMHPGFFSDQVITAAMQKYGGAEGIEGTSLLSLLAKTKGMMVLSKSTLKRLEDYTGFTEQEIDGALGNAQIRKSFVHTLEGISDAPYLLEDELPKLRDGIKILAGAASLQNFFSGGGHFKRFDQQNTRPSGRIIERVERKPENPDPTPGRSLNNPLIGSAINQYSTRLRDQGLMPPRSALGILYKLGLLKNYSVVDVEKSYTDFERLMQDRGGWEHQDLGNMAANFGISWNVFARNYLPDLIQKGLVRDLSQDAPYAGPRFYVIGRGKLDEVRTAIAKSVVESE